MPETKPLVDASKIAEGGSRATAEIHDRTGLQVAIIALTCGGIALGMAIGAIVIIIILSQRASISENHWRTQEQKTERMQDQLEKLEKDYAARSK